MRPDAETRRHAGTGRLVVGGLKHDVGGYHAVSENRLLVVNVINEAVECEAALAQAVTDRLPLPRGDHAGNDVEGPGPVYVTALGIDGEGDAHFADGEFGSGTARRHFLCRQLLQEPDGPARCGSGLPLGGDKLIKEVARLIRLPALVHRFPDYSGPPRARLHRKKGSGPFIDKWT